MIVSVAFLWVPSTAPELGLESVSETLSFSLTQGATYEPLSAASELVSATAQFASPVARRMPEGQALAGDRAAEGEPGSPKSPLA